MKLKETKRIASNYLIQLMNEITEYNNRRVPKIVAEYCVKYPNISIEDIEDSISSVIIKLIELEDGCDIVSKLSSSEVEAENLTSDEVLMIKVSAFIHGYIKKYLKKNYADAASMEVPISGLSAEDGESETMFETLASKNNRYNTYAIVDEMAIEEDVSDKELLLIMQFISLVDDAKDQREYKLLPLLLNSVKLEEVCNRKMMDESSYYSLYNYCYGNKNHNFKPINLSLISFSLDWDKWKGKKIAEKYGIYGITGLFSLFGKFCAYAKKEPTRVLNLALQYNLI